MEHSEIHRDVNSRLMLFLCVDVCVDELPSERVVHVVILFMAVFLEVVGFLRNHLWAPIYGIARVPRVQSKTADAVKHILDVRTFPPQVLLEKRLCDHLPFFPCLCCKCLFGCLGALFKVFSL